MSDSADEKGRRSAMGVLVVLVLKLLWTGLVVLVPLMGVWVASSLAAFNNGPIWLVCIAGLLAFPILPLLWDARGQWKRRKKNAALKAEGKPVRDSILTFWDRLTLRTLAINLTLLTALLLTFPQAGFTALATRGDWMLGGSEAPWAEQAREVLFTSAESLEWLYDLTRENPYEQFQPDESDAPKPKPKPTEVVEKDKGKKTPSDKQKKKADNDWSWPFERKLHPVVDKIPASAEKTPKGVALFIKGEVKDPLERVKALHDYVADRIAYDAKGLADGSYVRKQDLDTIWRTKTAVCAGYARLLVEMGTHTGDQIVYVTGVSRDQDGSVDGVGHAWNAVEIEGRWFLMDVTWNAGSVSGVTFKKKYTTDYFLTPPEVFGLNHYPDDPEWQLRKKPMTRGEFIRQPMLGPAFYAEGFEMLSPKRSQITAKDTVEFTIDNPKGRSMLAHVRARGGAGQKHDCKVTHGKTLKVSCALPGPGEWGVHFFSSNKRYSMHWGIGRIQVNSP